MAAFTSETASLAGKKSKRGISERTKILDQLFDGDKAKQVFQKLESQALEGNMDAIKTYLAYCFGKPEAKIDLTSDGEQIGYNLSSLSVEQLNTLAQIKSSLEN